MTLKIRYAVGTALAAVLATGCVVDGDDVGRMEEPLGIEGRWHAPDHILTDGDSQNNVEYTGAGPWVDEATSCQGSFTAGGQFMREYLQEYFPQVHSIGGYACRPIVGNPNQTSVHASGRALDLMIRTTSGVADNDLGDPIAHWLIQNADRIGIQYIIWDRTTWAPYRAVGDKERLYGGENPHIDHLHIELSVEAGNQQTPWFGEDWEPPVLDACPPLPAEGGVIDDVESCAQLLGPPQFWRIEEGAGYGGRLAWTNAISRDTTSNWARWQIVLSEAGEYRVEIAGDPEFSQYTDARYELKHGDTVSDFVIDQSQLDGWHELGTFQFAAGGGQQLAVFDNNTGSVGDDQRITADAIRLIRIVDGEPVDPPDPEPKDPDDPDPKEDGGGLLGGCSSTGGTHSTGLLSLLVFAVAFGRRRRSC